MAAVDPYQLYLFEQGLYTAAVKNPNVAAAFDRAMDADLAMVRAANQKGVWAKAKLPGCIYNRARSTSDLLTAYSATGCPLPNSECDYGDAAVRRAVQFPNRTFLMQMLAITGNWPNGGGPACEPEVGLFYTPPPRFSEACKQLVNQKTPEKAISQSA
jgi:hypothetical protein